MDYKKQLAIALICLGSLGSTFIANNSKFKVFIVYNTLSCHQCNIELNKYFSEQKPLKNKTTVLPVNNSKHTHKSAKIFYPEIKIKYLPIVVASIPDSLTKRHSLHYPFVILQTKEKQEILTYAQLFSKGAIDTAILNRALAK